MTIDQDRRPPTVAFGRQAELVVRGGDGVAPAAELPDPAAAVPDSAIPDSAVPDSAVPDSARDFGAWVQPHWQVLQRFAARLVAADDRDDLLQDVLERAWRKRHTFDPVRGSTQGWLLAVTADRARRFRVRARPPHASLDVVQEKVVHESAARGGAAPPADRDGDLVLRAAVARLPQRRRMAVELHYYLGLPVAEVAAAMGCADGTVKATLSAARAELRAVLDHREDER